MAHAPAARLLVLFVTAFVDMVGLTMIIPLLPFYATELGASATVVGLLVSAFSVAQLAVAPVWGRFSDRYGRRPAILAGLLLTGSAYVIFAFAGSVLVLLLSRLVQGAGGGTIGVVQAYVADASPPEERTKSLGWLSAVTSLGAVAGPAFGSVMISVGGRSAPGLAAAALALLVAGFAARFLVESRPLRMSGSHAVPSSYQPAPGDRPGTLPLARAGLAAHLDLHHRHRGLLRHHPGRAAPAHEPAGCHRAQHRLLRHVPGRHGRGGALTAVGAGGGPCWGRRGSPDWGSSCWRRASAARASPHTAASLFLGFTLMPLGTAFLFPCVTGLLSRVVPDNERGLYMGVQHTFGGVSRVLFPVAAGLLMDRFGVGVPFWICGTPGACYPAVRLGAGRFAAA